MGKSNLQAGSFRRRMTLQSEVETSDGCGGFTTNWASLFDLWAQVTPVSSKSISRADNLDQEISHRITMRKNAGIGQGMRLLFGSRIFEIDSTYDPDETGRYIQCDARELRS